MPEPLVAAILAALVAAVGGLLAPRVIGRLPEPEPAAEESGEAGDAGETGGSGEAGDTGEAGETAGQTPPPLAPPKVPYAELAARPHLGATLAATSAVFAASLGWQLGLDPALPLWVAFTVLGVVLSSIDWHTRLLPKRLVLPAYPVALALAGLAALLASDTSILVRVAAGWAAVSGVYAVLWIVSPRGIGYGDVRLSGVVAIALATLGWSELVVGAYAGFVLGAVGGLTLAALRLVDRKAFPFGPFMVLGAWVGAMWGGGLLAGWG